MIEKFEEVEGRSPGGTSAADLPNVQKLRKELCDAQVKISFKLLCGYPHAYLILFLNCTTNINTPIYQQSCNESQIPDSLLERLLRGRTEFPPVCAIIGGILGQVRHTSTIHPPCA